jgi:hypothetical protein
MDDGWIAPDGYVLSNEEMQVIMPKILPISGDLTIMITTDSTNKQIAVYQIGDNPAAPFVPTFNAGRNWHKARKYLQRYHRRGERMKKGN